MQKCKHPESMLISREKRIIFLALFGIIPLNTEFMLVKYATIQFSFSLKSINKKKMISSTTYSLLNSRLINENVSFFTNQMNIVNSHQTIPAIYLNNVL